MVGRAAVEDDLHAAAADGNIRRPAAAVDVLRGVTAADGGIVRCAVVIDILHAAAVDGGVRHLAARQHLRRAAVIDSGAYGGAAVPDLKDMAGNG